MSMELFLKRISVEQLTQMQECGVDSVLADFWQHDFVRNRESWLLLDEHIFGFMRHENPKHDTLYEAVMGGTPFTESPGRDDYPRYFSVEDVRRMAAALQSVSAGKLETRFAATRDLFGGLCVLGTDEQALARLKERLKTITQYYEQTAQNGDALLLLLF